MGLQKLIKSAFATENLGIQRGPMSIGRDGTGLNHVGCKGGAIFTVWLPGLPRRRSQRWAESH